MTEFDKYKGLFAEQGDFDIPANYGVGIAIRPVKGLTVALDVTRIEYRGVASVSNRGPDQNPGVSGIQTNIGYPDGVPGVNTDALTGNDGGMGFGWDDMTVYKLGVSYDLNDQWTVRAGYNYGESPIADDQLTFNILAPATTEKHYSVGFTYRSKESPLEVTGVYMHAKNNTQSSCNNNIMGCVEIGMHQNYIGLNLSWVLDPPSKASRR
jgi:long-chain fatty acid transport protein